MEERVSHDLATMYMNMNAGRAEAMFYFEDDKRLATLLGYDVEGLTASEDGWMFEPDGLRTPSNQFSFNRPSRNINEAFKLVKLLEDEYGVEIDVRPNLDGCYAEVQSWPTDALWRACRGPSNRASIYLCGSPPSQIIPMAVALCVRALLDGGLMEAKKVVDGRRRRAAGL